MTNGKIPHVSYRCVKIALGGDKGLIGILLETAVYLSTRVPVCTLDAGKNSHCVLEDIPKKDELIKIVFRHLRNILA